MTKDEALRLALEAMEKITKQMLALRDELAERGSRPKNNLVHQKLWDSSYDVYANCAIPTAEDILDALEAKVEPVAWVREHEFELAPGDAFSWVETVIHKTPLYTTPPQRKPLTDEEIQDIVNDASLAGTLSWTGYKEDDEGKYTIPVLSPSDYQFARAIEAAHGIKGEA
jgi:hypothetical protein